MQQPTQTTPAAPKPATPAAPPAPPPMPPPEFRESGMPTTDAAALIRILTDSHAPEFQRAKACQRVGELGSKEAVPALAALLGDAHLSTYARYGLEPIADPSVDEALRAALVKLKGNFLIGVINSISKRRDAKAAPALVKMMNGADPAVARAAAGALGSIGGAALKDLQTALAKSSGPMKTAVADASLVCAERLLAEGKREQAMSLYGALSSADMPKPVRLAAMSGIIREETSTKRPR